MAYGIARVISDRRGRLRRRGPMEIATEEQHSQQTGAKKSTQNKALGPGCRRSYFLQNHRDLSRPPVGQYQNSSNKHRITIPWDAYPADRDTTLEILKKLQRNAGQNI